MASRFHPRLVAWFDQGLTSGLFKVPSGRHIVLNEFPRLVREMRLRASAGVDPASLHEFFIAINPKIVTVPDGSTAGLSRQLALEHDGLPALRRVLFRKLPVEYNESWFVYTPPLDVMRQSWAEIRSTLS